MPPLITSLGASGGSPATGGNGGDGGAGPRATGGGLPTAPMLLEGIGTCGATGGGAGALAAPCGAGACGAGSCGCTCAMDAVLAVNSAAQMTQSRRMRAAYESARP